MIIVTDGRSSWKSCSCVVWSYHHCILPDGTEWSWCDVEASHPHADIRIQLGACWLLEECHSLDSHIVYWTQDESTFSATCIFPSFFHENKLNEYNAGLIRELKFSLPWRCCGFLGYVTVLIGMWTHTAFVFRSEDGVCTFLYTTLVPT